MKSNLKRPHIKTSGVMMLIMGAVYLLFSIGIVKTTHFCMGKEASVAYFTSAAKKCSCSLFGKEKDTCCDDEEGLIKLEDSQKTLPAFVFSAPARIILGVIYSLNPPVQSGTVLSEQCLVDILLPPKILFKIHCSFVFYDKKLVA